MANFGQALWFYFCVLRRLFGRWTLGIPAPISPERLKQGLVFVLPGIGGPNPFNHGMITGLIKAGVPAAIRTFDWSIGTGAGLLHLRWRDRNCREAALLVEEICDYQDKYPGRPVQLIGHSAGAGVILLALENLPPRRTVDKVLLLCAAVSPCYDYRPALKRVSQQMIDYSSAYDLFFLAVGTFLFGTFDGKRTVSAGQAGFSLLACEAERQKRYSLRFSWDMLKAWNTGGHLTCMNPQFGAQYLAPLLSCEPMVDRSSTVN